VTAFPVVAVCRSRTDFPGDDIESGVSHAPAVPGKPGQSTSNQPALFSGVYGQFCRAESATPACLDLHENDGPSSTHDKVDLDAAGPNVLTFDAIPFPLEVERSAFLALATEGQV